MNTVIRDACTKDVAALTELYNQYILKTTITFDLTPYTVEQRKESWFDYYSSSGRYRLLVAEQEGAVLGYASSSQFRKKAAYDTSVETSIYLRDEAKNQGLGSELYRKLFEELRAEDVHRAYAGITLPNDASIAIHEKFGFEKVGLFRDVGRKFGRYWDVAWMEKAL